MSAEEQGMDLSRKMSEGPALVGYVTKEHIEYFNS